MLFRWRQGEPLSSSDATPGTESPVPGEQSCPTLSKAIERAFRKDKPEVLDLGPLCGATVVYLASRGARVTVEEFDPPLPPPPDEADEEESLTPPPITIEQQDARFDLVLAWEQADFISPERLAEFAAELRRVTAPGGWLVLFSVSRSSGEMDLRRRYRVVDGDSVIREPIEEAPRPRWVHPTRMIEKALSGFSIQGIHLQRNQTREFLAVKKKASKPLKKTVQDGTRKPPKRASSKGPTKAAKKAVRL